MGSFADPLECPVGAALEQCSSAFRTPRRSSAWPTPSSATSPSSHSGTVSDPRAESSRHGTGARSLCTGPAGRIRAMQTKERETWDEEGGDGNQTMTLTSSALHQLDTRSLSSWVILHE